MSDTEITFDSGPVTLFGSLRVPASSANVPAALLLAGSGPTDRNGDSALLPGDIGTLRFIADLLEKHGVASLRYDKLGSGATALGPYEVDEIGDLGFNTFVDAASAGLDFLAAQPGIDANRLMVIGHSDGALVALALATDGRRVSALGLLEPLSVRLMDLLTTQIHAQLDAVVGAGQLTVELADELRLALAARSNRCAITARSATTCPSRCATPAWSTPMRKPSPRKTPSTRGRWQRGYPPGCLC